MTKIARIEDYKEHFNKHYPDRDSTIAIVNWTRVKLLEGQHIGTIGWVRTRLIVRR